MTVCRIAMTSINKYLCRSEWPGVASLLSALSLHFLTATLDTQHLFDVHLVDVGIRKRALPNSSPMADIRCCVTPRRFRLRARGRLIAMHGSYTLTSVKLGCNLAGPLRRRCPRRNRRTLTRGLCHVAQTRRIRGRTLSGTRCKDRGGDYHGRPPCGTLGKGGVSLCRALCEST